MRKLLKVQITLIFFIVFTIVGTVQNGRSHASNSPILPFKSSVDNSKDIDSLDILFKKLLGRPLTNDVRIELLELSTKYAGADNKKQMEICLLLFKNPPKIISQYESSHINYVLGFYNYNNAFYENAFKHFTLAEKSFRELKSTIFISKTLNYKANILNYKKDFVGAEKLAILSLKIAQSIKDNFLVYNCYMALGISRNGLNDYKQALNYFQKSIYFVNKLKTDPDYLFSVTQSLNYISKVYQKKGDYKNSILYAKKGLEFKNIRKNEPTIYCYLTNNLGYSQLKLGNRSVDKLFQETLRLGDSLKSLPIQITSKTYLGDFFIEANDFRRANLYLIEAQTLAHKNNFFEDELLILKLLKRVNPKKQLFYSDRIFSLSDSLQNVERATRDKFARIAFETDEIVAENKKVAIKNKQLTTGFWLIFILAFLTMLSGFLLYKNRMQKSKTRELLLVQEQQSAEAAIFELMLGQQQKIEISKQAEKQRISLELHDDILSQLAGIRVRLDVELYKNAIQNREIFVGISKNIAFVEDEIRKIAHDLSHNFFADNIGFVEVVQELFAQTAAHSKTKFLLEVSKTLDWSAVSNDVKLNLFRIVQESLQNIQKHSQATDVRIDITNENKQLCLSISDNGKGFEKNTQVDGIGLKNMKIRAEQIGASLQIVAVAEQGTKINLSMSI